MSDILPSPGDTGINKTNPWLIAITFYCRRQLTSKYKIQLQEVINVTRKVKLIRKSHTQGERGNILNFVIKVCLSGERALKSSGWGEPPECPRGGQSRLRAHWDKSPDIHVWTASRGTGRRKEGNQRRQIRGAARGQSVWVRLRMKRGAQGRFTVSREVTRLLRRSFWLLGRKKTRDSQGQKQRDQLACGLAGENGSGKNKVKIIRKRG